MSSRSTQRSPLRPVITGIVIGAALLITQLLIQPAPARAQAGTEPGGCSCHSAQTSAWQASPHAAAVDENGVAAATCEGCHGPYVRGHPNDGLMRLEVDSNVCGECHSATFGQWEESMHAQGNVQCIGCHLSHSQTLRLTNQDLCLSCHQESLDDGFHVSHLYEEVSCTECHPAPASDPEVSTSPSGETVVTIPAPTHDFANVSAANCVACHSQDVREITAVNLPTDHAGQMTLIELVATADQVPELSAELETVQQLNRTLTGSAVSTLGLGIGVGGMFGIIFALAVGYVTQRKRSE